ncbi:MAG: DUF952 domain-containing protein [Alphaproteobacteria bacterium]|nr:DUF952 domain-containing protein [Alphaproteobacteria bacterium]
MSEIIYKVLSPEQWASALGGAPVEAPVDRADGYVHFSTARTLQETLRKWFHGVEGCMLLAFDPADFGSDLIWEPARGGELFPHVYGRVDADKALATWRLEFGAEGYPIAPEEVLAGRWSPAIRTGGKTP